MKPDSVSHRPVGALPSWHGHLPVMWLSHTYSVDEVFEQGLAGRPLSEAADSLGVPPASLRSLFRTFPVFKEAYDDGWDEWESESLRRSELALAKSAEGHTVKVKKVKVEKGIATRYEEEEYYPPAPTSLAFRHERRDRARFGKDVREDAPGVGTAALAAAAVYLIERGLGGIPGVEPKQVDQ